MNEKHMQYVLTVLKEGSFTNAAKKLYVSQPSLSQIIKTAESNLGAPIFDRSTDPITLTPAGQLYVEAARQVTTISTNLRKHQYGRQIRKVTLETLDRLGVDNAKVTIFDKGALDCTLKARVECAVYRSNGITENLPWGGVIK